MILRRLLTTILLMLASAAAFAANGWEEIDRIPPKITQLQNDPAAQTDDAVATAVDDNYLYIRINRRIPVKLFTILGQLLHQDTLQPGVYRYKLPTRGIFILKIGSSTRRVTA